MPCASRSPGATASIISGTLLPDRCTTQAPARTPNGIAPQMPSPPSQTAAKPVPVRVDRRILVPARDVVVEAGADDAGDDAPERDAEDEIPVAAPGHPAAAGQPDAGGDAEQQHHAVHVEVRRPDDVERAVRGRGDVAEDEAASRARIVPAPPGDRQVNPGCGRRARAGSRAGRARSPGGDRRPSRAASATASSPAKPTRMSSAVRQRSTRSSSVSTISCSAVFIRSIRSHFRESRRFGSPPPGGFARDDQRRWATGSRRRPAIAARRRRSRAAGRRGTRGRAPGASARAR